MALGIDIDLSQDFAVEQITALEEAWEGDCECEAQHGSNNPVCAGPVTARLFSCASPRGYNICEASRLVGVRHIQANTTVHDICLKPIAECWSVVPV